MQPVNRREFLRAAGAAAGLAALGGCASMGAGGGKNHVVVIGGGFGGATAARYLKRWGGANVNVTLIERDKEFISCPLSNLIIGGSKSLADITRGYASLEKERVRVVHDEVVAIDAEKHSRNVLPLNEWHRTILCRMSDWSSARKIKRLIKKPAEGGGSRPLTLHDSMVGMRESSATRDNWPFDDTD